MSDRIIRIKNCRECPQGEYCNIFEEDLKRVRRGEKDKPFDNSKGIPDECDLEIDPRSEAREENFND